MKYEYKIVKLEDEREKYLYNKKRRGQHYTRKQLNEAMSEFLTDMGKEGWIYLDRFRDLDVMMFIKEGEKKWKYHFIKDSHIDGGEASYRAKLENIEMSLEELGEKGFRRITQQYRENPKPHWMHVFISEINDQDSPDLDDLSYKELKDKATKLGIDFKGNIKKEKLVEKIQNVGEA